MTLPRTPSFRLDSKRALVTGGTSGIGLGCAVALAEHGAHVTLAARNVDRMKDAASEMRAEGWTVDTVTMDVADIASMQAKIADAEPYDICVNSAGYARHAPAVDTTEVDFDAMTDLNAKGAYFLAQSIAKSLIKAKKPGSIVQITSQMGHVGGQERAVYCGAKHAVEGYTKAQAIEWAHMAFASTQSAQPLCAHHLPNKHSNDQNWSNGLRTKSNSGASVKLKI